MYYILTDYISWRGGTFNVTRVRIKKSGYCDGYIKMWTSKVLTEEQLEKKAKKWSKKNNIKLT